MAETRGPMTDHRHDSPHRSRLNASQRTRMPLTWWKTRHGITGRTAQGRAEWAAIKEAADVTIEMRRYMFENRGGCRKNKRPTWDGPSAMDVITDAVGEGKRSTALLDFVAEVVHHRGVDLSDYVYRLNKEAVA